MIRLKQDRSRRSGHAHSKAAQDFPPLNLSMPERAAWKFCNVVALLASAGGYFDELPPAAQQATRAVKDAAALLEPALKGHMGG